MVTCHHVHGCFGAWHLSLLKICPPACDQSCVISLSNHYTLICSMKELLTNRNFFPEYVLYLLAKLMNFFSFLRLNKSSKSTDYLIQEQNKKEFLHINRCFGDFKDFVCTSYI